MAACFSCYDNTGIHVYNDGKLVYWISLAGNISSASYNCAASATARPSITNETVGKSLNFSGSQGLISNYLNITYTGNLFTLTCFVLLKYNIANTSATSMQTGISFDAGSYGRCFQAVDNRDGTSTSNSTYGPALFVGTTDGYVKRFRNNNGTGTPIQLAANTWYLVMFSYTPSETEYCFMANAYVDGKKVINNQRCYDQSGVLYGSIGCKNSSTIGFPENGFNGRIAEVLFYSRGLNDNERIKVETYFKNKWDLPFSYTG